MLARPLRNSSRHAWPLTLTPNQKIRKRYLAAPLESENLQDLVRNELKSGSHVATEGLVWLVRYELTSNGRKKVYWPLSLLFRGLEFTCIALSQNVAKPTEELADSFRGAYGSTLKPHHSFLVKPVFSAAMGACPYRKDFYIKLGSDEAKVQEELKEYLAALERIVGVLKEFLASKDAQWKK
jgi:hypothetical protein